MAPDTRYLPIHDYGIIGDCRSAALVSRRGSIDWLCWPRFDSDAIFAALLDPDRGGRFTVQPAGAFESTQRYLGATNVLETTFRTAQGEVRLIDLMPVADEAAKTRELWPEHQILRIIECTAGRVRVRVDCEPRPGFGRRAARLGSHGTQGIHFADGADYYILQSEFPLDVAPDHAAARGEVTLREGDRVRLALTSAHGTVALIPPLGETAEKRLQQSLAWWEEWASRMVYEGPYRDAVLRSVLALKLLTYAPSGAVIAAPTTSLPERVGGSRNWDYRYCWLRDASLIVAAFIDLGFHVEGESFLSWMLHATRTSWPEIQVLYDVYGETHLTEREIPELEGYRGSRPVRTGNGAEGQLQLDTYGEVVEAVYKYVRRGGRIDRLEGRLLRDLGETVSRRWREPDEGIWEIRSGRRHHTYSKVMCWVALDRLIRLARENHLRVPVERFSRERDAIRAEVESRGWNAELESYMAVFEGDTVDASLLLLGTYGFEGPASPRMRSTRACVARQLGKAGLLYRYRMDDGLPPGEGAFGICSFWSAQLHALAGDVPAARREFEAILQHANHLGLFAEEIDPDSGAALGNFPQGFTHLGLITAVLAIAEQAGAPTRGDVRVVEGEERVA